VSAGIRARVASLPPDDEPSPLPPPARASVVVWAFPVASCVLALVGLSGTLGGFGASVLAVVLGAVGALLGLLGVAFADGRRLAHLAPLALALTSTAAGVFQLFDGLKHFLDGLGKIDGRPFRRHGRPRAAEVVRSDDWRAGVDLPPVANDPLAARRLTSRALAEHASIAAFAQLTLDLLAHGAPPALVRGALSAALDEVEHARLAFALASAHAGAPVGPGTFEEASPEVAPLPALAHASDVDGVANEGAAAARLFAEAEQTECPSLRALLAQVASDEARHAAFAVEVSAWCTRTGADSG
jgi:hypothetical protein